MAHAIILVDDPTHIKNLNNELKSSETKVLSLNVHSHKALEKEAILHEMAENYLSMADRSIVFDLVLALYRWYDDPFLQKFEFENTNLLGMLDTAEFHQLIINNLISFLLVKRIIEKENPKQIVVTNNLYPAIQTLVSDKNIDVQIYGSNQPYYLPWDKIQIKLNLGRIPISLRIGRKKYLSIVNLLESVLSKIFNLWFKFENNKKTVLLLEFDPSQYENLLSSLSKHNVNVALLNRRRTALWNSKSIKSVLNSNCKIINSNKILSSTEKKLLASTINNYRTTLEKLFSDNEVFNRIFSIEGYSFWPCIKPILLDTYKKRIPEYLSLLLASKKIFEQVNISCILALNIIGETEKSILNTNKNDIPFVMLEHGFANHTADLKRFDIFHMYPLLKDKIAVWGDIQKNYLITQRGFDIDKILVTGSPRHDPFFHRQTTKVVSKKTVLITPHPITNLSGLADTNLYLRLESLLRNLCTIVKKIPDVDIIVKLHPGQDDYSDSIITLLHEIDPKIPIYQLTPIINLIESCDLLVNISPESFDTSTVIMEGLIMRKPVMNIILDDKSHAFPFVQEQAVLSISDKSDLQTILNDALFDQSLRSNLQNNGREFLEKYLANHGNASEYLANIITSFDASIPNKERNNGL